MNTRLPGKLLKKKLSELNSALFFAEGDALIKLSNHLITEMDINEAGEILFVVPRPAKDLTAFETEFPVRMEFFKKGKAFRLKVRGKGYMITDQTEIESRCAASTQLQDKAGNEPVIMIKVLMQYVDYAGSMSDSLPDRIKLVRMQFSGWLFSGSGRKVSYAE
jgi:hypothetical protein